MILDSDDVDSLRSVHKMVKNINIGLREKESVLFVISISKLKFDIFKK